MSIPDLTVWHDGSCPRCRLEIKFDRRQSDAGHIRFVNATDHLFDLGDDFPREEAMRRLHASLPDAELRSGATLVCAIVDARRFSMACA